MPAHRRRTSTATFCIVFVILATLAGGALVPFVSADDSPDPAAEDPRRPTLARLTARVEALEARLLIVETRLDRSAVEPVAEKPRRRAFPPVAPVESPDRCAAVARSTGRHCKLAAEPGRRWCRYHDEASDQWTPPTSTP